MAADVKDKAGTLEEVVRANPVVLVDFFAEWCGPCKMMGPILEDVKSQLGDKVKILKVNVEKNVKAAARYQVTAVPTLILFRDGKVVWRHSGIVPPSTLKQIIESK